MHHGEISDLDSFPRGAPMSLNGLLCVSYPAKQKKFCYDPNLPGVPLQHDALESAVLPWQIIQDINESGCVNTLPAFF